MAERGQEFTSAARAYASGFASLRRFNDAFSRRYRMPPSILRKHASAPSGTMALGETLTLQLSYRPPFDWPGLLDFLGARALKGVERVEAGEYCRTVRIGSHQGWIRVRHAPERRTMLVQIAHSLTPILPALLGRLRHLFDLNARPDIIAARLGQDRLLAEAVARNPGLRVPGAFDGFELALRAILGQQITVRAATTLAGRLVAALGEPIQTPYPDLARLSPTPQRIAAAKVEDLTALGIVPARARSIVALAKEVASGRLRLEPGAPPDATIRQLLGLPGIGPWTAQYMALRTLGWPDAFPKEDIALRQSLGGVSAARAAELSQAWRPWRGYAALHLWRKLWGRHDQKNSIKNEVTPIHKLTGFPRESLHFLADY